MLNSLWDHICNNVSEARNIEVSKLNEYADKFLVYDAQSALKHRMIDGIRYYDEILAELQAKSNEEDSDDFMISLQRYNKMKLSGTSDNGSDNEIAVIFAQGDIVDGDEEKGGIAGDYYAELIRDARKNDDVKAVVLRINSGGGSGLASEIMWREVSLTNQIKPVVVTIGNYAASGGYYIACPASYIFAQPNTVTGSIGVFGMLPNVSELLTEKIGIGVDGVKTNTYSDFGDFTRPVNNSEREIIQRGVEDFYTLFIGRVSEGRNISTQVVDSIGQGRIWSGVDALKIGLVDEIGGLNDAVKKAVELAGIYNNEYKIVEFPNNDDFMNNIMLNVAEDVSESVVKSLLKETYDIYASIENAKSQEGIQARVEYVMTIY